MLRMVDLAHMATDFCHWMNSYDLSEVSKYESLAMIAAVMKSISVLSMYFLTWSNAAMGMGGYLVMINSCPYVMVIRHELKIEIEINLRVSYTSHVEIYHFAVQYLVHYHFLNQH